MNDEASNEDEALLSPADMKLWLKIEARTARLVAALRIREAKSFVAEYASGRLSAEEEADLRLRQHEGKWGQGAKDEKVGWQLRDEAADAVFQSRLDRQAAQKQKRSK
jgi:hypothetical protein